MVDREGVCQSRLLLQLWLHQDHWVSDHQAATLRPSPCSLNGQVLLLSSLETFSLQILLLDQKPSPWNLKILLVNNIELFFPKGARPGYHPATEASFSPGRPRDLCSWMSERVSAGQE